MFTVGTYEAKTRLSELLQRVAAGEKIAITRHGEAIAHLIPPSRQTAPSKAFTASVARWRRTRKNVKLKGCSVRDLINEGRR